MLEMNPYTARKDVQMVIGGLHLRYSVPSNVKKWPEEDTTCIALAVNWTTGERIVH